MEALKGSSVIGTSRVNHMGGLKQTKETNVKTIKLNKTAVTLKAKKAFTLKPTIAKERNKPLLTTSHGAYYRYATSDSVVATVDSNGKITAKAPGTCIVYVIAQNGRTAQIVVTVQ